LRKEVEKKKTKMKGTARVSEVKSHFPVAREGKVVEVEAEECDPISRTQSTAQGSAAFQVISNS
jgi:hypothetical protein